MSDRRRGYGAGMVLGAVCAPVLMLAVEFTGSPAGAERAPGPELHVMSFNIRNGRARDGENHWTRRREILFELLRDQAADVMGLQEAFRDQIDEIRRALPGYGEIAAGRDDGKAAGEHCPILYRAERFRVKEHGTLWFSDTPEQPGSRSWGNSIPRICTWARLEEKASGRSFTVYNLHLDHESQPSRERSVQLLRERIRAAGGPVIVIGDFNAGEANPAMRALLASRSPALADTFRVLHPDEREVLTFHAFEGGTQGEKIDYLFASPEFQVLEARILRTHRNGRYPSDHYPVTARLRFRG